MFEQYNFKSVGVFPEHVVLHELLQAPYSQSYLSFHIDSICGVIDPPES